MRYEAVIHPDEALRDYAVGELEAGRHPELEQHLAVCGDCALELDRLRLTTAALRTLPDCELPQRIAFVSDKVFEPSPVSRWFGGFWNSAARLGFASACVLAAALIVSAYHRPTRPVEVRTVAQASNIDVARQVNDAVAKAVAQIRLDDARVTQAAVESVNRRYEQDYRARMAAVEESFMVLQKRLGTSLMAANDLRVSGDGQ